uniref:peptidoglycan glycosyltransferase n=1 Tax=uncultured bacterium esnapd1.2 TaxID=1366589 RepID=S5TLU3_9BACT|nr:multimodular transpeptidase-transglycosylase [uncultured bacterium esnapd1.2]
MGGLWRKIGQLTMLPVCGALVGVLLAAMALPVVGGSGLAVKVGMESFAGIPVSITMTRAPQATTVYANDGRTLMARFADENRRDVRLADVAPIMRKAMVAAEDQNFYLHRGVDVRGVARAAAAGVAGQSQQGASTLTMQLVRMSLIYTAETPQQAVDAGVKTPTRKVREMRTALEVEKQYDKDDILERYLNMAPFGRQTFGVHAASRYWFAKSPKNLTVAEAAMLAGMVKAPSDYDPATADGMALLVERRNWVVSQLLKTGGIGHAEAAAATATKIKVKGQRPPVGCVEVSHNDWGFFCDFFRRWWLAQKQFGTTAYDRERQLNAGGYRITTTLDPAVQRAARHQVHRRLSDRNRNALMVAAVQPGTGAVRALATNRRYAFDDPIHPSNKLSSNPERAARGIRGSYPNTTNPLLTGGGDITGYQGGSTFKIFTLIAALEQDIPLNWTYDAPAMYHSQYKGASGGSACPGTADDWCPTNSGSTKAPGRKNGWTGFGLSVNTFFIPLTEKVGAAKVVDVAQRLGITFRDPDEAHHARTAADGWGSFPLGVSATTPLDMANAYATLAADGKHCRPTPVQRIIDADGERVPVAAHCRQVIDRDVARAAIDAARCPVGDQSAFGRCAGSTAPEVHRVVDHPVAGKTGTTDGSRTATLVATTRSLTVAGIMADPDWANSPAAMDHRLINPAVYETLADAMRGRPRQDFPAPSRKLAFGDTLVDPQPQPTASRRTEPARRGQ